MESLSKMKVADLKKHLKNKGLPVTGNKTELVERLQQALQSDVADENPTLDSSGAVDDEEFDEEEILGGDDVDIGKITQEEEAAALAGNLKVKDDSLLLGATQPEKKKITLKRSAPSLSSTTDADTTQSTEKAEETTTTSNTETSTNLDNDKENSLGNVEEPKHKVIKLSGTASENALEARAKKFGSTITTSSDTDESRRLARAARFGVEPTPAKSPNATSTNKRVPKLSMEVGSTDLDKLKKRAERFGVVTSKSLSKLEELEKKKQRQNRFSQEGDSEKTTEADKEKDDKEKDKDVSSDDAKAARANRFGAAKENGTTKEPITAPSTEEVAAK